MGKPIIGVSTSIYNHHDEYFTSLDRAYVNKDYIDAIERNGGVAILIPVVNQDFENIKEYIKVCDGIIFSGGHDVNPIFYNEPPHVKIGRLDNRVDRTQIKLMKESLKADMPLLGICRGAQLLNIINDGTLYQDLSDHKNVQNHLQHCQRSLPTHKVNIKEGSYLYDILGDEIFVNSYHHQAIKELGDKLEVLAYSEDGIIEAIKQNDKKHVLGIQWHPEMMYNDSKMNKIFENFIKKCK